MSRRTKIILAVFIIVLVILAILLLWWNVFREQPVPTTVIVTEEETTKEDANSPLAIPPVAEIDERTSEEISVETLAKTFAERFGSYSNESEFANLADLETLMTFRFQDELDAMVASTEVSDMYRGITTQVVSINITSIDDDAGVATVSVLTQREEAIGGPTNTEVRYETLVLELLKISGVWKVDDATWQS